MAPTRVPTEAGKRMPAAFALRLGTRFVGSGHKTRRPMSKGTADRNDAGGSTVPLPVFPIVGIGASAGGLEALRKFFAAIPHHDREIAFVILVRSASRSHLSLVDELRSMTRMKTVQVTKAMDVKPRRVYVIAASRTATMEGSRLRVAKGPSPAVEHEPIDRLFLAIAQAHRERAMCVLLSGTGADGSAGLQAVKDRGGTTFVQTPGDARYDAMPRNAIATGAADFVLPAAEIAQKVMDLGERLPPVTKRGTVTTSPEERANVDHGADPRADTPEMASHQHLLELYAPPSLVIDARMEIVHLSESAGRFLRFPGGEPSTNLLNVVPIEWRPVLRDSIERALESSAPTGPNTVTLCRGEARTVVDITIHPARRPSDGAMQALVVFAEQPHEPASIARAAGPKASPVEVVEHELRQAYEFMQTTFNERRQIEARQRHDDAGRQAIELARGHAVIVIDERGTVSAWNTGARKLFGYDPAEAIGRSWEMIFTPDDRSSGAPAITLESAREIWQGDQQREYLRSDGSRVWAATVISPLPGEGVRSFVLIARDMMLERETNDRLKELLARERDNRTKAVEANRLKDEFLATLSHELRNPLNTILMHAESLLRAPPVRRSARLQHAVRTIHQMAATQARLMEEMLDVSKMRLGKLEIRGQLLPLPFIVGDAIGAVAQEARQKRITIETELPEVPVIVEADPMRVKQIVWNLLTNAVKFTPAGGRIFVRVSLESGKGRIDIEDNGQGIDPSIMPVIFDPFRQGDSGTARQHGGLGIGLAIVKQLVELQRGRVSARSAGKNQGACFTVWLPLDQGGASQDAMVDDSLAGVPGPLATESEAAPLTGLSLLVVDDEAGTAEILKDLLEDEGANVEAAASVAGALEHLNGRRFSLILSDIAMPGVDGLHFLQSIKSMPLHRDTPVVAMSGYGRTEDIAAGLAAGFAEYIVKPVQIESMVAIIRRLAAPPYEARSDPIPNLHH